MAWAADKEAVKKVIQIQVPPCDIAALDETMLVRALAAATARVESVLLFRGYDAAAIQADNTSNAFHFCDNLILNLAAVQVLEWLRANTPQASELNITAFRAATEVDLAALRDRPRDVLGDFADIVTAPAPRPAALLFASTDDLDLAPAATFTRASPKY